MGLITICDHFASITIIKLFLIYLYKEIFLSKAEGPKQFQVLVKSQTGSYRLKLRPKGLTTS